MVASVYSVQAYCVTKAAMDLKAGSRVILTGTPVQNNLNEVWNLFQFLNPGIFVEVLIFRRQWMLS